MNTPRHPVSALRELLVSEAGGGIVLMISAVVALCVANSPLAPLYFRTLAAYVGGLSVLHWINDALMAVFFLLVGLEIKRELLDGQLARWSQRALPGLGALGGMIWPGAIYAVINLSSPETLRGWAIPAATDIAFSLGVLALLAPRVPVSLKIFLTALAIIDDLGAVVIIALFYTANISLPMLGLMAGTLAVLIVMNRLGVVRLAPYLVIGCALWFFMLKSGVHATVAGVLLAMTIPLRASPAKPDDPHSPLHVLEHALHPWVAFAILPVFALANAGVSFAGMDLSIVFHPVTLGVALGLFAGKQIGVFGAAWLAAKTGLGSRPPGATWLQVYGVSLLCGIGFTMSLFIGLLAFSGEALQDATKVGVIAGSVLSAVLGFLVLRFAPPHKPA